MDDSRDKTLLDTLSIGCNGSSYDEIVQAQADEPSHYNEWTVQNVDELYGKVAEHIAEAYKKGYIAGGIAELNKAKENE